MTSADERGCPSCGAERLRARASARAAARAWPTRRRSPEERKTVTTLFCDLVGFTAMSEASGPRGRRRLPARATTPLARKVIESLRRHRREVHRRRRGRRLRRARRARGRPRARRARRPAPGRGARGLTRPDGTPLEVRVGVNTGEALVRLDVDPGSRRGLPHRRRRQRGRAPAGRRPARRRRRRRAHPRSSPSASSSTRSCRRSPPRARPSRWRAWLALHPLARTGADAARPARRRSSAARASSPT